MGTSAAMSCAGSLSSLLVNDSLNFTQLDANRAGDEHAVDRACMYVGGESKYFGLCGRVTAAPHDGHVDIRVLRRFRPTDFPTRVLAKAALSPDKFVSVEEATRVTRRRSCSASTTRWCRASAPRRS